MIEKQKAQGTIEYLVIIGIVVVLSLVVVGFVLTQTNTIGDVSNNSNQLSSATNQLAIKETVIGTDGNGLLIIQNNSPDTITLNKIVSGPITLTYDQKIVQGNTSNISIDLLAQTCVCGTNDKTKTCPITITYTTQLGITKKQIQNITLNCVTTFSPAQTTNQPTQIITTTNCFDATQEPIPLCTISDLNRVRDYLDRNFILRTDINAGETLTWDSGAGFEPIGKCDFWSCWMGNYANTYSGTFNGNNKTILNLYINRPTTDYVGLFGVSTGPISDLGLIDNNTIGQGYVGGLIGLVAAARTINNVYNTGNITANGSYSGGIIGYSIAGSEITNSYNLGHINNSSSSVGGITGLNYGTITNSYNTGNLNGTSNVGGISGSCNETITDSYSTGDVNGTSTFGGIVGNYSSEVVNSYYDYENVLINGLNFMGFFSLNSTTFNYWLNNNKQLPIADDYYSKDDDIYLIQNIDDFKQLATFGQESGRKFRLENNLDFSGENNFYIPSFTSDFNGNNKTISNLTINLPTTDYVGLFGYSTGNISNLGLIDGNITGNQYSGGIVGYNTGTITNSYNTGNINGINQWVGGLAGYSTGTITNSYNTGNMVGAGWNVGGITGANSGTITNSYNIGNATGINNVGGIAGNNSGTINFTHSKGIVIGSQRVGGIIGYSTKILKNSFSLGDVNGVRYVGGLIGNSTTTTTKDINMNYSISKVTRVSGSATEVRGFVGLAGNTASIGSAYWSPTLSTYSICYRYSSTDTNTNCTAITSTATNFYGAAGIPFANLLFDGNWTARDGNYPILTWQTQ